MNHSPEGENAQAKDAGEVEEIMVPDTILDYLWSAPEEEQSLLEAGADESGGHAPLLAETEEEASPAKGDLSSVLNNYNGWLNTIADS